MGDVQVDRSGGVVTITLARPQKKNAISGDMWDALIAALREVHDRRDDRVLVITGSGDSFCAGQDLSDPVNAQRFSGAGGALRAMRTIGDTALALHEIAKPTIAAVNGVAAGAGANLALGCDLVYAAQSARFSQIFVQRGLTVDFGGTYLLPRLVGLAKAKELAFTGAMIGAEEAERIGLVNAVFPDDALADEVRAVAERLAAGAPLALSTIKRQLNDSARLSMAQALEAEGVAQAMLFETADVKEAVTAFNEKRTPTFRGE